MSVATLHTVRISPLMRDPGVRPNTPALIARWLGTSSVVCDATGGLATITLNMGGVGELYGSHALWDLQIITVDMDAVPLSAVAITLQVNSYEAEGGGSMTYSWFPGLNTLTYYLGAQSSITSLFKFRSSDAPGFPSNVRLIAANIVGQKWYVTAAGYVYDERLI